MHISYHPRAGGGVFTLIPLLLLLLCLFSVRQCDTANILILEGVPSPSHHLWMRTLSSELVRHGHNVTSLSCDVEENPPANLTYLHLEQVYTTLYADFTTEEDSAPMDVFAYSDMGTWTKLMLSRFWQLGMLRGAIRSKGFQQLLDYPDEFPFDLIIYDTITSPAMMAFVDKFKKAPVISVTPFPLIYTSNHITGSVYLPAFVPNQNLAKLESGFWERLNNFLLTYAEHYYMTVHLGGIIKSELAERVPQMSKSIEAMYAKTRLLMPNYNPAVNLVQPLMPMVIPVGGLQISARSNRLPSDFEELYAKAQVGVVYFSLGTNIQSEQLGGQRLNAIIEAFRALPEYTFLWKMNVTGTDVEQRLPGNVHVRQWLPQNDILAHKKTLLFISHGGGLSTQETTWFGLPMLGVPVFLDQHANVNQAVASGMAMSLNLKYINSTTFKDAIQEMLTNPKYKLNAQLRSKNFQDQKEHPLERAIWWIDYVLRNPDISFLKHPELAKINVYIKHSIDIIAFLLVLGIGILALAWLTIRWVVRRSTNKSTVKQNQQKKSQ